MIFRTLLRRRCASLWKRLLSRGWPRIDEQLVGCDVTDRARGIFERKPAFAGRYVRDTHDERRRKT